MYELIITDATDEQLITYHVLCHGRYVTSLTVARSMTIKQLRVRVAQDVYRHCRDNLKLPQP